MRIAAVFFHSLIANAPRRWLIVFLLSWASVLLFQEMLNALHL